MSAAGVAAQEMRVPLKTGFLHNGQALGSMKSCWGSRPELEDNFLSIDPITMAYSLNPPAQERLAAMGHGAPSAPAPRSGLQPFLLAPGEGLGLREEDAVVCGFQKLSVSGVCAPAPPLTPLRAGPGPAFSACAPVGERGSRPLPPLPVPEDPCVDAADCEVEFLTSSDTDLLLEGERGALLQADLPGRRSFRGCGQINYAYLDTPATSAADLRAADPLDPLSPFGGAPSPFGGAPSPDPAPPPQAHRRLRRSHSGPAGSFHKPTIRVSGYAHRASPNSDDDKPEVPPRVPIPPRPAKPDYRRWSAEVTCSAYSDEDRPPKVPPREPLSRSNSRTPSPKSLPSYLNGVMPPTQSFAPDPKYVSSKALQRQNSEGAAHKAPCILPIIENGRKVSSTHYYLLPERPPYLDRYEKFFREAEESRPATPACGEKPDARAKAEPGGHGKRKHLSYVVSP
ncbi:ERBB receptor feedback inhibitor 1 [Perognathus longimembris pacificus]|uniref:ERBB receptor feedback inhibitor 1 n=1 Tax=Perognathus longimembris pacificus TaxID=214514 RepID=UPI0020186A58|nr:ERBB receptor feedback inhibitor 1 [Perognathus longimembris pacificus]XP_048206129.1 ERBB receptor feedback inhibitor 1 [Perognathus longimembris pacificus]